jgi:hypothetical protein
MPPLLRHTLASLAAWTAGAVVAVSVGVLALSAIGDGWASGAPQPLLPAGAGAGNGTGTGQLGASPSGSPASAAAPRTKTKTRAPVPQSRTVAGSGGTVDAQCAGSAAYLVSWSPAQGYEVGDVHRGPGRVAWVKFSRPGRESTLVVRCVDGIPQADANWHGDEGGAQHD